MLRDMCFVLLISVVFSNHLALSSGYHVHPNKISESQLVASLERRISYTDVDPMADKTSSNGSDYFVLYQSTSTPKDGYSGGMATLDVYNFPYLKKGEASVAIMLVLNYEESDSTDLNFIQVGWAVDPSLYGDSKTHFFVAWTIDNDKSTGCFNLDCEGFVPVNGAPLTPGDTLEQANNQTKISFKIFKNKDDGDWWLHFGYDVNNLNPVGYWPKNIFTRMVDHATKIKWGGYVKSLKSNSSPPMGNGEWPGKKSASFQNVQYVDTSGKSYSPPIWPIGLDVFVSDKKCYQASIFTDNMFYYGGPGGCTN